MQEKTFSFRVEMTCDGCSRAVQKVLDKHKDKGVSDFNIDLPEKTVRVKSANLSSEEVMAIVKKTGKDVTFLSEEVSN